MEKVTLPETNSSPMKIPIFPGKYHQNGGFSMAMLVYRRVNLRQFSAIDEFWGTLKLSAPSTGVDLNILIVGCQYVVLCAIFFGRCAVTKL